MIFSLCIYLYYIYFLVFLVCFVFFLFSLSTSYYLFMPSNYIVTIIITVMFINITVTVFLRNQMRESSKKGIQAAWSNPIHQVK